tara:strand:- start:319 stop:492 length:174 start_codon:yes stop_codon:yes gene_type:complete
MKKILFLFIFLISCISTSSTEDVESPIIELPYQDLNGEFVSEDLSNKKTIIIFWADY